LPGGKYETIKKSHVGSHPAKSLGRRFDTYFIIDYETGMRQQY